MKFQSMALEGLRYICIRLGLVLLLIENTINIAYLHKGNLHRLMGTILIEKKVSKASISRIIVLRTSEMFMRRKMEVATTEILCSLWWIFISMPYSMPMVRRVMERISQTSESA